MAYSRKRQRTSLTAHKKKSAWNKRPMKKSYALRNFRTEGFTGIELKFADFAYSGALATDWQGSECDPATALSLNAVAQGDGESSRDGRRVIVKKIHLRGQVSSDTYSGTGVQSGALCRVMVVHDKQTNGAQLNAEDVMVDAGTNKMHTFRNLEYSRRFNVLYDQVIELNQTGVAGDGTANDGSAVFKKFDFNKDVDIPVTYSGTTAAIGSITDNSIHVIAMATTTGMNIAYQSRVRFVG